MPEAFEPMDSSPPSTHLMPRAFSPSTSQRRRSSITLRRTSSAPNLHSPSSCGTTSSDDPRSSPSSSSSRFSDFHHDWRRRSTHESHAHSAPPRTARHGDRVGLDRSATEPSPMVQPSQSPPANLESATRTLEEVHRVIRELQRRDRRRGVRGLWVAARAFFGYGPEGSTARKDMVSLTGKILFGAGQIGTTIALLYIAARDRSPTDDSVNEWQACPRPLGVWCAIWLVRVILGCIMAIWGYRRRNSRVVESAERDDDETADHAVSHPSEDEVETRPPTTRRRSTRPQHSEVEASRRVSAIAFARLSTLLSLLSLSWFITAHVLIYTSVHTCRLSAPHLWWLTFGIICIGYLVIVEVIVVAFLIFILGPLIFLILNLILICMGRDPLRLPTQINPEVGKLPHKAVDCIPLVLYIPAPAPKEATENDGVPQDSSAHHSGMPVAQLAVPELVHVHSYPPAKEGMPVLPPPESAGRTPPSFRRLFTFRRIRLKKLPKDHEEKGKEKSGSRNEEQGYRYEDKWERGDYPFVKLEGNRAACAICLCDFEEPKRVRYSIDSRPAEDLDRAEKGVRADSNKAQTGGLTLTDAGEGAQPLRLLACAHVFHKTCLDPWLTEVSGRCPICQRPVEVDEEPKTNRPRQRRRARRR